MFDKIIGRGIKRGGILAQSERLICHRLKAIILNDHDQGSTNQ